MDVFFCGLKLCRTKISCPSNQGLISASYKEGVHLTEPLHISPVQVNSRAYYIISQWGRVQDKIKET